MADEVVISVDHVSKNFVLPHEKISSVKGLFTSLTKGKSWKSSETQHALKDISFQIKKGEFFGIVGRNGSGKSTMLKILAGIYQPTEGAVATHGKLVPFIELGVGFNAELTGRENVFLNGALLGFSKSEIDAMYDEVVAFAELEKFMDQKLKNYSSGMQVRLAFSMATRADADILLVDEVLAVGDADFQRKCYAFFRQLKKDKKTVVFVSHDMDAIREYCDNAVLIEKSVLVDYGKPSEIAGLYSKLFNQDSSIELKVTKRWGSGGVKIVDPAITVNKTKKTLDISFGLEAVEDSEGMTVGFGIKNGSGLTLAGTNSKILGSSPVSVGKGSRKDCSFTIDNVFSDGTYTIDIALVDSDGVSVKDWWEDAATVKILKTRRSPYLISPDITYRME